MPEHLVAIGDELDHDWYQSRRVLTNVAHLRRSEIVRQAIADRDGARRLLEMPLWLEQGIEFGFQNIQLHVVRSGFGLQ